MPRVLIAGCGYVGTATGKLFRGGAWKVTAWTRKGDIADRDLARAVEYRAVDLRDAEEVQRSRFACNVVVHCASSHGGDENEYRRIYRDGAENLVRFFPDACLIFTSSTSVYAQRDGSWVDESSPAQPQSEKAKMLRAAEEIVLGAGGIVLRLGGIYGPGRSFFLRSLKAGAAVLTDRYVNQIHRDDAASAIWFLAQRAPIAPARIFNVVDDTPAPRREILQWLSARLQVPLPGATESQPSGRGESNKRVSNTRLRSLGWSPLYPSYREGLPTAFERILS